MSLPQQLAEEEPMNLYEQQRAARILRNKQVMGEHRSCSRDLKTRHDVAETHTQRHFMQRSWASCSKPHCLKQASGPGRRPRPLDLRRSQSRCASGADALNLNFWELRILKVPANVQPISPSKRRSSTRLANLPPQNKGLTGDERETRGACACPSDIPGPQYLPRNTPERSYNTIMGTYVCRMSGGRG